MIYQLKKLRFQINIQRLNDQKNQIRVLKFQWHWEISGGGWATLYLKGRDQIRRSINSMQC
jgi:hypothetical protein